ncbi:MAG TPA: hypothetical protein VGM81_03120 [Burkholderiaceae bacterium]|jgi:hypothetical protein
MNRLQSELSRLYLLSSPDRHDTTSQQKRLDEATGMVRGMVLELAAPADWSELSTLWRGVQTDLRLPAPAIAVSGSDGMQLWFSLQEPTSLARASGFLAGLRTRYLSGIAPQRVRLLPSTPEGPFSMPTLPQLSESTGNWSAFIAADLAAVFVDTPWLDVEPSVEGQADLLSRLESIKPSAFEAALQSLSPAPAAETPLTRASNPTAAWRPTGSGDRAADIDAQQFLQQVLNDDSVELALRIEAAKGLLGLRRLPSKVSG